MEWLSVHLQDIFSLVTLLVALFNSKKISDVKKAQ